jgi:hypothetical protein
VLPVDVDELISGGLDGRLDSLSGSLGDGDLFHRNDFGLLKQKKWAR